MGGRDENQENRNGEGYCSKPCQRTERHWTATHCLLTKRLVFQDEEEKKEYNTLLDELETEYQASGRTEWALVEEIAICLWKLQILNGWEVQEITNRRKAAK